MAASKKKTNSAKHRAGKKPASKRQPSRGSAKNGAKRTDRGGAKRAAAKTPRSHTGTSASSPTSLSSAALGAEPERKSVKKAEPRSGRPPAVLPIPQSTFFF